MSYSQLKHFPFGKYKGQPITSVLLKDPSYVLWYLGQTKSDKNQLANILRFWIEVINRLPFNKLHQSCYDCGDRPDMVLVYRVEGSEYYRPVCEDHKQAVIDRYEWIHPLTVYGDVQITRFKQSALNALLLAKGYKTLELTGKDQMNFLLSEDDEAQLYNLSIVKTKPKPRSQQSALQGVSEGRDH